MAEAFETAAVARGVLADYVARVEDADLDRIAPGVTVRTPLRAEAFSGHEEAAVAIRAIRADDVEMNTIALLKQLAGIRRIPRPLVWLTRRQLRRRHDERSRR